jgi:glycosyltransferase involved in cell wall biosynthesis
MLDLALGLRELGIECEISTRHTGGIEQVAAEAGFTTHQIDAPNWMGARGPWHGRRRFLLAQITGFRRRRWIRKRGFDLIHSNSTVSPVGAWMAYYAGLPHIWHVREGMPPREGAYAFSNQKICDFVSRTTAFMVGVSQHTSSGMVAICPPDRIRMIYNGPLDEAQASRPLPDRTFMGDGELRLLCVGRSGPAKGHDVAARALTALRNSGVNATLTIAGAASASFETELRSIAPEGLNLLGFVSQTDDIYRSHDILIMASKAEAFGRVTVEAMANGCVVVGSKAGATPEIIDHGRTGVIFSPDDPSGCPNAILSLIESREKVIDIRSAAHSEAYSRFTHKRYASDVLALYDETLGTQSQG